MSQEEDDVPQRRRGFGQPTEFIDAVTRPHKSANTSEIPVPPVRIAPGPTELLESPTRMMGSAEEPAAVRPGTDITRIMAAAVDVQRAAEAMVVEDRPLVAQVLGGVVAALSGTSTTGALEAAIARLVKELWLVDSGIGGRFGEAELSRLLVEIAIGVAAGVEPQQRAAEEIAAMSARRAAEYRRLQRAALGRKDQREADRFDARADELEAQVRELRKIAG